MTIKSILAKNLIWRTSLSPLKRLYSSSTTITPSASTPSKSPALAQAPNAPETWSESQQPKSLATSGPRFEQTNWEYQPNPISAQELIAQVPIKKVNGRKAVCDGGGGALGHPKVYINLDKPGPAACGYCGLRFEQEHHHH